jgi:DNA-binding NarL/FixJ family response regulator
MSFLTPAESLTQEEKSILIFIAADLADRQIAEKLRLSEKTINGKVRLIYAKLGVQRRTGAISTAFCLNILSAQEVLDTQNSNTTE